MDENWRESRVKGLWVSDLGRVKIYIEKDKKWDYPNYKFKNKSSAYPTVDFYNPKTQTKRGYSVPKLIYGSFKKNPENKMIRFLDGDNKNLRLDNLYTSDVYTEFHYVPVTDYCDAYGSSRATPHTYLLSNKKVEVAKLQNADYQKKEAERLFNWLLSHVPHGIFRKFIDRVTDYDARLAQAKIGIKVPRVAYNNPFKKEE